VVRRDFEQSNLAQAPARRSESGEARDIYDGEATGSPRAGRGLSSQPNHSRYNSENVTTPAVGGNGTAPARMPSSSNNAPRRRTTVTAQTGQWALGKTIGQGSMGKVKLARNMETGEQV